MKNKQTIILLFIANIISGFAQGITMLAIPWYFTKVFSMESFFALVYATTTFICIFWGLYAGVIVDKYSRKKVFLILNLISGIIVTSIALIGYKNGNIPIPLIVAVFSMMLLNFNVHYPNLYAFCQELTKKKDYKKITSYLEIAGQTTTVLSAAIAAILIEGTNNQILYLLGIEFKLPFDIQAWTLKKIFLLDGITYFASLLVIFMIPYKATLKKTNNETMLKRMQEGISFLLNNKWIFVFGIFSYTLFAFLLAELFVVFPSYVNNYLKQGADVMASSEVYYSLGALFSGFFIGSIFAKRNSVFSVITLILIASGSFLMLCFIKKLLLFFIASFLIGFTNAGVRIFRTTYLFNRVPNNIIGRVNSVLGTINTFIRVLLILVFSASFFSYEENIKWAYLIGAVFLFGCVIPLISNYKNITNIKDIKE